MSRLIDDLAKITDAAYQADLARLQAITAEETALRDALADLGRQERETAASEPSDLYTMRQIGSDILWKAWLGRKREALNLQLAMVMARKLSAAQALKLSFGKNSVTKSLRDQADQESKAEIALKTLSEEQAQLVLRSGRNFNVS